MENPRLVTVTAVARLLYQGYRFEKYIAECVRASDIVVDVSDSYSSTYCCSVCIAMRRLAIRIERYSSLYPQELAELTRSVKF